MPPVRVADVAHGRGDWERLRRLRLTHQAQAGFVRESFGLEGIDFLLRPNEVLERIAATAIARDDVVQVAAILADEFAKVLANAPVAFEDRRAGLGPASAVSETAVLLLDDPAMAEG